jgi:hypothetical protein
MTKPYQMRISKLEIVVNENKQKINLTSRTMYQKMNIYMTKLIIIIDSL